MSALNSEKLHDFHQTNKHNFLIPDPNVENGVSKCRSDTQKTENLIKSLCTWDVRALQFFSPLEILKIPNQHSLSYENVDLCGKMTWDGNYFIWECRVERGKITTDGNYFTWECRGKVEKLQQMATISYETVEVKVEKW